MTRWLKSAEQEDIRVGVFKSKRIHLRTRGREQDEGYTVRKIIIVCVYHRGDVGVGPQSTYIYRAPQCMSPRWNWDSPTPLAASECALPLRILTLRRIGTTGCRPPPPPLEARGEGRQVELFERGKYPPSSPLG